MPSCSRTRTPFDSSAPNWKVWLGTTDSFNSCSFVSVPSAGPSMSNTFCPGVGFCLRFRCLIRRSRRKAIFSDRWPAARAIRLGNSQFWAFLTTFFKASTCSFRVRSYDFLTSRIISFLPCVSYRYLACAARHCTVRSMYFMRSVGALSMSLSMIFFPSSRSVTMLRIRLEAFPSLMSCCNTFWIFPKPFRSCKNVWPAIWYFTSDSS
mmetsp:Transcript_41790/g.97302  ORF Transcript_41790/g.97302 Transcript_41790/m.97302 type:complete len:208 (-) Transcript_41790:2894-3517(-)